MTTITDFFQIDTLVANYRARLEGLAATDIDDLSINELALVKLVSASSITAMRQAGKCAADILRAKQKAPKKRTRFEVAKYIAALSPEDRDELLNSYTAQ